MDRLLAAVSSCTGGGGQPQFSDSDRKSPGLAELSNLFSSLETKYEVPPGEVNATSTRRQRGRPSVFDWISFG